jgi:hypothetical protein
VNYYLSVLCLILISISGRFVLIFFGQTWIKTFAHTVTILFLPIITFVITKVISGNIALSLGMVGALSIVRFRNPVRSPFELAIYFLAISMGIVASVSDRWLGFFVVSIIIATASLCFVSFIYKIFFKKQFFSNSFSEGSTLFTLTIDSKVNIKYLEENKNLISELKDHDGFRYTLSSSNKDELKSTLSKTREINKDIQYNLNI